MGEAPLYRQWGRIRMRTYAGVWRISYAITVGADAASSLLLLRFLDLRPGLLWPLHYFSIFPIRHGLRWLPFCASTSEAFEVLSIEVPFVLDGVSYLVLFFLTMRTDRGHVGVQLALPNEF